MSFEALAKKGRHHAWCLSDCKHALIVSTPTPEHRYIGLIADLKQRLEDYNAGKSAHTSKFKPWRLVTYVAFSDRTKAESFERYLRSGSGHAFANRRLW